MRVVKQRIPVMFDLARVVQSVSNGGSAESQTRLGRREGTELCGILMLASVPS